MDVTLTIPSTAESLSIRALSVRGFDDVDDFRLVRPVAQTAADGTVRRRAQGFQRVVTIDLGRVTSVATQSFLVRWLMASDRTMTCSGETAALVPVDPAGYAIAAATGKLFKHFVIRVVDRTVRRDAPPAWQDSPVTWTTWGQTNIRPFGDTDYTLASLP